MGDKVLAIKTKIRNWWSFRKVRHQIINEFEIEEQLLKPSKHINSLSSELYEAHCRELAIRYDEGWDLAVPTTAEIVGFLGKKFTENNSLPDDELALFVYLSDRLFPDDVDIANRAFDSIEDMDAGANDRFQVLREFLVVEERSL